jgi:hypothetical protein
MEKGGRYFHRKQRSSWKWKETLGISGKSVSQSVRFGFKSSIQICTYTSKFSARLYTNFFMNKFCLGQQDYNTLKTRNMIQSPGDICWFLLEDKVTEFWSKKLRMSNPFFRWPF